MLSEMVLCAYYMSFVSSWNHTGASHS